EGSVQILELQAVIAALQQQENDCLNSTFKLYVVEVVKRMNRSFLGHVSNSVLFAAFTHLWHVLQQRSKPLFVTHIRTHTNLPGGLVERNARADALVSANVVDTATPGRLAEVQKSHAFYHQSSAALKAQFQISKTEAKAITAACPDCARLPVIQATGANPQGLQPRQIRQTDVTEYPKFGCQKYLHVTVDTCSGVIWATALNSTSASAAKKHWLQPFAVLGKPEQIKTDNGPAYRSSIVSQFMADWQIKHVRGVPYNSMGQAIVERTHRTLKHHLD
ncbi:hypothetical protein N332_12967, partial [Mesitornis unicolor]